MHAYDKFTVLMSINVWVNNSANRVFIHYEPKMKNVILAASKN